MAEVRGVWTVQGTTVADGRLDVTGLTPDEIAERVDSDLHAGISLCHQCDDEIGDPEPGELVAMYVDGVLYERGADGHWSVAGCSCGKVRRPGEGGGDRG